MKKMIAAMGISALMLASAPLMACDGMGKHEGEAKGFSIEKQTQAKSTKAAKKAKKDQAAKADKTRAKL